MKRTIFIAVFIIIITGAFFFYNTRSIADDKDGKCCSGQCVKTENCQKECKSECSTKNGKTSGGDMKECPYMTEKTQSGDCPYKSEGKYKHESTKKSGSCPYMKREAEVKI